MLRKINFRLFRLQIRKFKVRTIICKMVSDSGDYENLKTDDFTSSSRTMVVRTGF